MHISNVLNECSGLDANNLSVNEAIDMAENCPPWRLISTIGGTRFPYFYNQMWS